MPVPNQAPTVNAQAENYLSFINRNNAPRGQSVTKPFHGVFSDPDGDELTYTVSVPADHRPLVQELGIPTEEQLAQNPRPIEVTLRVFFEADADDDWNALVPALPDPLTTTVTLTATDPDGLSASVKGDFLIDWESHPELLSATASREAVKLTFNQAVQGSPGPTAEQLTVNVVNEDDSTGTIAVKSVSVSGAVITLELASALVDGQTVTLDYAHDDDTPLKRAAEGGDSAPDFTGQAIELSLTDPPGSPENFAVSTTPGELNLAATWDAVDGATSYKLSWRQADGNFDPGNQTTISETSATITVSGHNRWVIRLNACNDSGCGPEVDQTVDVLPAPAAFRVAPTLNANGKLRSRTITASWDSVPDAASYSLRWWRTGTNAQAQDQARRARSTTDGGQGANNQGGNQRTFPADQTSTDITVSENGVYQMEFEVLDNDNELIAMRNTHIEVWLSGGLNANLFPMFDCRAQSRKITDIEVTFSNGSVRVSWDDPGISAITKYQYMLQEGNGFGVHRGTWRDVPGSNAGTTSHTVTGLVNERTYGILLQAVAGSRTYCFESLAFVTLFDVSIPLITGFDAWKTWDDGAQEVTLFWDDPDDDTLTYEYWYEGVPAHWSGYRGTPGWKGISGTPPAKGWDGTMYTTLSGLPCEYYYYNIWIRPRRGDALGPVVRTNYIYTSDHVYPGETTLTGDRDHECLSGWGGNDKVYGNRGNDILKGHGGNDQLYGGPGNDQLDGGPGDDQLKGDAGDDRLEGGPGADKLDGGPGTDTVYYSGPYASVDLTITVDGTYTTSGGHGEGDTLVNIERFAGLAIALFLVGDEGNNVLQGYEGDDTLTGKGGDDFLIGSPGNDTLDGGTGTDTADYAGSDAAVSVNLATGTGSGGYAQGDTLISIENLIGSSHGDTLTGDANANNFRGGDGCDILNGGAGDDTLIGDDGCDTLNGNDGNDMLFGNDGVDTLNGNNGNDTLNGGAGNDALDGGAGNDTADYSGSNTAVTVSLTSGTGSGGHAQGDTLTLNSIENLTGSSLNDTLTGDVNANVLTGGAGNDTLVGRAGADALKGDAGTDIASYAGAPAAVTVNLNTGTHTGEAQGDTFDSIEIIRGSSLNDTLTGNGQANHLQGAAGNDTLIGLAGADILKGDAGSDTASYAGSNTAVTVNLATGTGSGGHAQGDTLSNIENLIGSSHNDTLIANDQPNSLDGGTGTDTDTASYAGSNAAVTINLNTGTHTGDAQGDTFTNIEIIRGSPQDDTLTGNGQANHLQGAAGNDTLIGLAGADTLDGEGGTGDTASYAGSNTAVTVNLATGTGSGGHAQGDTLSNIENLIGSSNNNDTLIANGQPNSLDGGTGTGDTASYAGSNAAVTVNLNTGTHTGDAQGDTFTNIEIIRGSPHNDTLTGNGQPNHLQGAAGNDTLIGLAGADTLDGEGGTGDTASYAGSNAAVTVSLVSGVTGSGGHAQGDTLSNIENLIGSTHNDTLIANDQANSLDGGAGTGDTASYAGSTAAVTVNLNTNTHTGDAQGDTFTNIEIIRGSPHDDTLTGNGQANHLKGAAGNDTLIGLAGADKLDGEGGDDDIASYAGAPAAVTVNLSNGVHTGHAQGDTFTNIEIIRGSPHNDTLIGNNQANHLKGAAGNDTLIGLAGADTLDGEGDDDTASYAGSNTAVTVNLATGSGSGGHAQGDTLSNIENLIGSTHNDTLIANDQANSLDGGAGTGIDTASYAGAPAAVTVNLNTGTHTGHAQGDTFTNIEIIRGSPHNDTLTGNGQANHLKGAAGNDTLIGLAGADTLDGEGGTGDTASYAGSNTAVTVSLVSGVTGSGGHAQGDTLSNIENLIGSTHNDTLIANDQANSLDGGAGTGTDTASYAGATAAVTVNLNTGTHTGDAQGDTFTNIEIIRGSPHDDTLTGNGQANHLKGAAGNDTLIGLAGADTLDGEGGTGDTASYAGSNAAVTVSLNTGVTGSGGHAQGDTLSNIENLIGSPHDDTLIGNSQANSLSGGAGNDTLTGNAGIDMLSGGDGDDQLVGNTGNDTLNGNVGDDTLNGGAGSDTLNGGDNSDTADYADSNAGVTVTLGGTASGGHAQGDTLNSIENLSGSRHADNLNGNSADNTLRGGGGNDMLWGGAGADTLHGGDNTDTALYASSNAGVTVNLDTETGTGGHAQGDTLTEIENVNGSAHDDVLTGDSADNTLKGFGGNDTLIGLGGADALDGGIGNDTADYADSNAGVTVNLNSSGAQSGGHAQGDTLTLNSIENLNGSDHGDILTGNSRANTLRGGAGVDTLNGGAGDDALNGGNGADTLNGDAGDDTLNGGAGGDALNGGGGRDTADYAGSNVAVIVNLNTGTHSGGHAQGDTLSLIENITGSSQGDTLTGNDSANVLTGGDGNDTLVGRGGGDTLNGGDGNDSMGGHAGNDALNGGNGNDTLAGGSGADMLNGGEGTDTVDYFGSTAVTVNLATGTGSGGDAQGDTLTLNSIENIVGSSQGDTLTGNDQVNVLTGGDGDDTLNGGAGGDTLRGDNGSDTADYAGSTAGVTVNLGTGTHSGGDAQGDTLSNIENLAGSSLGDTLTGDASANVLTGGAGNDTLNGGAGGDMLNGGTGTDALTGGNGSDEFYFHANFSTDTIADYTLGASKAASEEIHLCMGTQANPPTHSGADSGSNHVITVTFNGSTAGTITLTGITTSSTNFANLNIIIAASTGTACTH